MGHWTDSGTVSACLGVFPPQVPVLPQTPSAHLSRYRKSRAQRSHWRPLQGTAGASSSNTRAPCPEVEPSEQAWGLWRSRQDRLGAEESSVLVKDTPWLGPGTPPHHPGKHSCLRRSPDLAPLHGRGRSPSSGFSLSWAPGGTGWRRSLGTTQEEPGGEHGPCSVSWAEAGVVRMKEAPGLWPRQCLLLSTSGATLKLNRGSGGQRPVDTARSAPAQAAQAASY